MICSKKTQNSRTPNLLMKSPERIVRHIKIKDSNDLEQVFQMGTEIGEGGFGKVIAVKEKNTNAKWAMKSISKSLSGLKLVFLQREIQILKMVNHPHIVYLDRVYESTKKIYLIMELCNGELWVLFKERKPFSESISKRITTDLVSAVAYLHKNGSPKSIAAVITIDEGVTPQPVTNAEDWKIVGKRRKSESNVIIKKVNETPSDSNVKEPRKFGKPIIGSLDSKALASVPKMKLSHVHVSRLGPSTSAEDLKKIFVLKPSFWPKDIVHRDIKLENILLAKNPNDPSDEYFIKLSDFGLSVIKTGTGIESMLHDCCGTALYMAPEMLSGSYSHQCDVWAIGVIIYLLLYGVYPFFSSNEKELARKIMKDEVTYPLSKISTDAVELIKQALKKDPAYRITSAEMLDSKWLAGGSGRGNNMMDMMKEWRDEIMAPMGEESDWVSMAETRTIRMHSYSGDKPIPLKRPSNPLTNT
ncbi:serine/threonine-protein kinase 33-like isoform X2 [Harmonia axyridis]|uniref:serine/threonine-protein kinase 33-like isoform X2 n=1 Tax=Harmonia axyridis TaxID=115357 RepID=UPI001E2750C0|nr:serine/threonine-protein kinase 33-like isoform X2 [Harmonia axyridis]